jgi:hypothetical protein
MVPFHWIEPGNGAAYQRLRSQHAPKWRNYCAFIVVSVHIAKTFMALQLLIFLLKEQAGC